MLKTHVSRVAAGAALSAALTADSLSLTATAASACTGSPNCGGGPPPAAAPAPTPIVSRACRPWPCPPWSAPIRSASAARRQAAVPRPGSRVTGRGGHAGPARAVGGVGAGRIGGLGAGACTAINCPPSIAVAMGSGGGGPGC